MKTRGLERPLLAGGASKSIQGVEIRVFFKGISTFGAGRSKSSRGTGLKIEE